MSKTGSDEIQHDIGRLYQRFGPKRFESLRESSLRNFADLQARFVKAAADGDIEALRLCAHSLKSSVANYGVSDLADYFFNLEKQYAAGKAGDLTSVAAELPNRLSPFVEVLKNYEADAE